MGENDGNENILDWNNVPKVILYEVFKYLPVNDRLQASSTCKYWRSIIFYPSFWESIRFTITSNDKDDSKVAFFRSVFGKKVKNSQIYFNSLDRFCVEEVTKLLHEFKFNQNLKKLMLLPQYCRLHRSTYRPPTERRFFLPLYSILENCKGIRYFSLGCLEELLEYHNDFITLLSKYHSDSIRVIGFSTLKYDPDNYIVPQLDVSHFNKFSNLQILSIDFDILDDTLLNSLRDLQLSRLIIHVHGLSPNHPGTSDMSWDILKQNSPRLQVRINLIHAYELVNNFHTVLLRPSMPLSHLRVFFCEQLNKTALNSLVIPYCETLQSLWWIDSFDSPNSDTLLRDPLGVNPFVFLAWRCSKLKELVLFGYKYFAEDVFAICRLRGFNLQTFKLAASNIIFTEDDPPLTLEELESEVSSWIGINWKAENDDQLNTVLLERFDGASDEYILPIVLNDLN